MRTSSGQETQAVYGFVAMATKMLADFRPDGLAVAFDRHEPTFRDALVADYKAGRPPTPEPLIQQVELIRQFVTALGCPGGRRRRLRGGRHPRHAGDPAARRRVRRRHRDGGPRLLSARRGPAREGPLQPPRHSDYVLYDEAGILAGARASCPPTTRCWPRSAATRRTTCRASPGSARRRRRSSSRPTRPRRPLRPPRRVHAEAPRVARCQRGPGAVEPADDTARPRCAPRNHARRPGVLGTGPGAPRAALQLPRDAHPAQPGSSRCSTRRGSTPAPAAPEPESEPVQDRGVVAPDTVAAAAAALGAVDEAARRGGWIGLEATWAAAPGRSAIDALAFAPPGPDDVVVVPGGLLAAPSSPRRSGASSVRRRGNPRGAGSSGTGSRS